MKYGTLLYMLPFVHKNLLSHQATQHTHHFNRFQALVLKQSGREQYNEMKIVACEQAQILYSRSRFGCDYQEFTMKHFLMDSCYRFAFVQFMRVPCTFAVKRRG